MINPGEIQDRKVRAPKSKTLVKMSRARVLRKAQQKIYRQTPIYRGGKGEIVSHIALWAMRDPTKFYTELDGKSARVRRVTVVCGKPRLVQVKRTLYH